MSDESTPTRTLLCVARWVYDNQVILGRVYELPEGTFLRTLFHPSIDREEVIGTPDSTQEVAKRGVEDAVKRRWPVEGDDPHWMDELTPRVKRVHRRQPD